MQITENKEYLFETTQEAIKFVRNLRNKAHFFVQAEIFLPTSEGRGFPGGVLIDVSRRQIMQLIEDCGRVLVNEREGKIRLQVDVSKFCKDTIFVYFG